MRVFFAGELPPEKAVSLLRAFRERCGKALGKLGDTPRNIAEYSVIVSDESKNKYWRVVDMFGESFYRAELEWTDNALSVLEDTQ
jgi:hypothetical protein